MSTICGRNRQLAGQLSLPLGYSQGGLQLMCGHGDHANTDMGSHLGNMHEKLTDDLMLFRPLILDSWHQWREREGGERERERERERGREGRFSLSCSVLNVP